MKSESLITVKLNCIGGVMVSVLAQSAVDCGFEPQSDQTKDYKINIGYYSTKYAALSRKSKDWLAQNQDNMSVWATVSVSQYYKNPTKCVDLV